MVIGGALSLSDRRLRVGAPKPAQRQARAAAGGVSACVAAALLVCSSCSPARRPRLAVQPDEMLADPALEARARDAVRELRCMVCQNQSIDDSDAPLARDLRILVRERLKAGDSDPQVIDFLVARYGEFVLLKPPLQVAHGAAVADAGRGLVIGAIGLSVRAPASAPNGNCERRATSSRWPKRRRPISLLRRREAVGSRPYLHEY